MPKINCVPTNINLESLDEGCGIAETFSSHSVVYHKSCYLKFTSNKLERVQKKRVSEISATSTPRKPDAFLILLYKYVSVETNTYVLL